MIELPQVDETRCTGCGDCVVVCPVDCLQMAGPLPWLVRPLHCISCSLCVLICPDDALQMVEPAAA
jgi:NAD-dependent dihydropyrimidine dehydrogenase PreA subunit